MVKQSLEKYMNYMNWNEMNKNEVTPVKEDEDEVEEKLLILNYLKLLFYTISYYELYFM